MASAKRPRASKSSAARKLNNEPKIRREPLSTLHVDDSDATGRPHGAEHDQGQPEHIIAVLQEPQQAGSELCTLHIQPTPRRRRVGGDYCDVSESAPELVESSSDERDAGDV